MADTDARAIQARMDAILGELCSDGFGVNVRGGDSSEWRAALQREYAELALRLPKAGAQAGVLVINGRLSAGPLSRPEPVQADDEFRGDPMLRWMAETGQDWK